MKLVENDAIGRESLETGVTGAANIIGLRTFSRVVDFGPELRRDYNVIAPATQSLANEFFAFRFAVHVGCIEKIYACFDSCVYDGNGLVIAEAFSEIVAAQSDD